MSRVHAFLITFIGFHAVVSAAFSITRHVTFKTSAYDIGAFTQMMFNMLQGNSLFVTIVPPHVWQPWFAFHFSPILYAVVPVFAFFQDAKTLLILHSVLISVAAWPLYLTLREVLQSEKRAALLAGLYLINPYVWNAGIWDFHEIAFAPLFFACGFLAVIKRHRAGLVLSCIMLLMIKEHYGLAVFGFAWLWYLQTGDKKTAVVLGLGGVAFMAFILGVIIPHLNPHSAHLMMQPMPEGNRYQWLSNPLSSGVQWSGLFINNAYYAFLLLAPFLLLPLASFAWLLPAISDAAANVLSLNPMMRGPYSYHNVALIVVLFVAAAQTLARMDRNRQRRFLLFITIAHLFFMSVFSLVPGLSPRNPWEFEMLQWSPAEADRRAIADIKRMVGRAPIMAQNNIGAHFAKRAHLYQFPSGAFRASFIVLRPQSPFSEPFDVMDWPYGVKREVFEAAVDDAKRQGYTVIYDNHGWVLLHRRKCNDQGAVCLKLQAP